MNTANPQDNEFTTWSSWFSGLNDSQLKLHFARWQELKQRHATVHEIVSQTDLDMITARRELEDAIRKLTFDEPYRVVVLGETGAGKSTLLNALLAEDVLVTGSGGAVTGVATYLYPQAKQAEERGRVKLIYSTEQQLLDSARRLTHPFNIELPSTMEKLTSSFYDPNGLSKQISNMPDTEASSRLYKSIQDFINTWKIMKNKQLVGKPELLDASDPKDHQKLKNLIEEESDLNKDPQQRIIPGIVQVEYYLDGNKQTHQANQSWNHVVIIDTPGIGARTMRHQHILQAEVKKADAVILVVNSNRPEEHTDRMAKLLEQVLFEGYSPEEKNRFSRKVFLVVNKIDIIKTADDRRRLTNSINAICEIIADNYLKSYGTNSSDQRYFETQADSALQSMTASTSQNYLDSDAYKKSNIPALQKKLQEFLGKQRLKLSLDEAEVRLERAIHEIRQQCEKVLQKHHWENTQLQEVEVFFARHTDELCQKQLDEEQKELLRAFETMRQKIREWRSSDKNKDLLSSKIDSIYVKLAQSIQEELKGIVGHEMTQFPNSSDKDGIGGLAIDDVTGKEYPEVRARALLLKIETKLRHEAEKTSRELANYYLNTFDEIINSHGLYKLIETKYHDQTYAKKLDLIGELETQQTVIRNDYEAICRWVILFELIQRPILIDQLEISSVILQVIKVIAPALVAGMESTMTSAGIWPMAAKMVSKSLGLLLIPASEEQINTLPATAIKDPQFMEDMQLINQIMRIVSERDLPRLQELIGNQFSIRYRSALSVSLAFIEDLFFYEFGKFRLKFEDVTEQLKKQHLAHTTADTSERNSIRTALMAHQSGTIAEIRKAIDIIKSLEKLQPSASISAALNVAVSTSS
jgi:tRNA U34 5-carboxymethylaminomethyl modifying GTPase MnmE/TrmE